ncbi:MAG: hypothetical protein H0T65_27020 [Deltaproteobacteria bacterium]|nr:hypothetical protein [Deltaproteobacteria bacterium]
MKLALAAALAPAAALAQPVSVAVTELTQSVLPNVWATTPGTTAEVRFDYSDIDQLDLTMLNALAHVQHLTPQGFGGYVRVPFIHVSDNEDADGMSLGGSGIGNVELGALFLAKLGPTTDLLARGGVAIGTASEDDQNAIALSTVLPRLVDFFASGLHTTWGRGQAQLRHEANNLRFGAALGVDMPVAGEGADLNGFTGVVSIVAGAGFQHGKGGIGFSVVMLQILDDQDEGEENLMGVNLGADYALNPDARLFVQMGLSLENNSDGTSIGLGARVAF